MPTPSPNLLHWAEGVRCAARRDSMRTVFFVEVARIKIELLQSVSDVSRSWYVGQ